VRRFKSAAGPVDPNTVRSAALALLLAAFALAGSPAAAEIYRCTGADGKTLFTADAAACPGAQRHAPTREVQRVGPAQGAEADAAEEAGSPAAPGRAAEPVAETEDAQAAMWRRKRTDAEAELGEIERSYEELEEIITWCNRGGDLIVEDRVGLREDYSCDEAREAYETATGRRKELKRYLAGGLEDECRRAGCLPGWIR
jgi:Domain of unknown function (DUF4124)